VKIQDNANNAHKAGVPYNIHQKRRVSAALLILLGYNSYIVNIEQFL
jgi:hypothetical protein